MSQNISGIGLPKILTNLDTYNHTALLTSPYVVECNALVIPTSGLSIVIQLNGSTKLTSTVPASQQQAINSRIVLSCAVNDVISVILSSSVPMDALRNDFKAILSITPGLVG